MAKLETIRAFVAVRLSADVTNKVAEFGKELRRDLSGESLRITWVPPANIHQTIKFLGPIDPALVDAIEKALRVVGGTMEPFSLTARGFGVFPSPGSPRVLWVGLEDPQGGLRVLRDRVEGALADMGFEKDPRAFVPHLTLGRIRKGAVDLSDQVKLRADVVFGECRVTEVLLYESRLRRNGAEYVVLGRAMLGAAAQKEPDGSPNEEGG